MTDTRNEAGPPRLASALMASGSLTTDWLPSYQAVPREEFVPDRIWPGVADGTRQNPLVHRNVDPQAWLEAVYSDIPLTTQWDDGNHQGDGLGTAPTSSSSMPTMVFSMLADLDADAGMRVLEIGTGTGWNCALLAHRLGDANVTSIEYDAQVARDARAALTSAGYSPTLLVGDGRAGHPLGAPFDRVIATCSIGTLPPAWIEQTRPGGVIVAPYGTEYGGENIVRLVVGDDGAASGRFTRSSAFMRLRQQRTERPLVDAYLHGVPWPAGGTATETDLSPAATGSWLAQFVIGLRVPGAFWRAERYDDGAYTLWLYSTDGTGSWATADYEKGRSTYAVVQFGPRRLWDEVEAAYHWWAQRGEPSADRFGLTVTATRESTTVTPWLDDPANTLTA
ncbi:methyltransferase domain-containing protein [Streptacidiphilus fuscans]|uniref:Protein-L-isoaspartate O-methyltransferase n=1 Tax=Streptacidiphilus fuscans TaxID=2789292 RepID=A0A931AWG6_9ACTN|nr:methyltransferase domain-containing protein [Streptacidiphilus fuscans]MBF9066760.1 methyltransferase domain-containing protein [Streptacidiphilus fuscans]